MLFKPELIEQIKLGNKTQTRRVVKPGEALMTRFVKNGVYVEYVEDVRGRTKWQVGKQYAMCPGRGSHGVGFIKIQSLREDVDVRLIGLADAQAEGFEDVCAFLSTWIAINDRRAQACWEPEERRWIWYAGRQWHDSRKEDFVKHLMSRPSERYHAWVIGFEFLS